MKFLIISLALSCVARSNGLKEVGIGDYMLVYQLKEGSVIYFAARKEGKIIVKFDVAFSKKPKIFVAEKLDSSISFHFGEDFQFYGFSAISNEVPHSVLWNEKTFSFEFKIHEITDLFSEDNEDE